MGEKVKKRLVIGFILLGILFMLILIRFVGVAVESRSGDIAFSTEEWENHVSRRENMLNSLFEQYSLVGMTQDSVMRLLGTTKMYESSDMNGDKLLHYLVGHDYFMGVYLTITFDTQNVVIEYMIRND